MNDKPSWSSELAELFAKRFGHAVPERELQRMAASVAGTRSEPELDAYLSLLRTLPLDSPVLQALIERGMNNESYFFRDAPTMESLRERILPRILEQAASSRVLRVWSAGCSSGEELYTLSILLHELVPDLEQWNVVLLGTDVDGEALEAARKAEYKEWSLRSTAPDLRRRYFDLDATTGRYRLRDRYRRNVAFDLHNLADHDAPLPAPACFDLILCRNVSIYFTDDARGGLHRTLLRALAREGSWVAGPSDPAPELPVSTHVSPGVLEHRHPSDEDGARAARASVVIAPIRRVGDTLPPPHRAHRVRERVQTRDLRAGRRPRTAAELPRAAPPPDSVQQTAVEHDELALLDQARALADHGNFVAAREIVQRSLDTNAMSGLAHLLDALLAEAAGETNRAMDALRRTLYLDPTNIEAHLRLGLLLVRKNDHDGARRALRNAASLAQGRVPTAEEQRLQQAASWYLTTILKEEGHG